MQQTQFEGLFLFLMFPHICPYLKNAQSTGYSLEVCHYATKQSRPSRLSKKTSKENYCMKPRICKCSYVSIPLLALHCPQAWILLPAVWDSFCNAAGSDIPALRQSLDLLPARSPHCTSTAVTLSNVHEIKGSGPSTDTVAYCTPCQHWGLRHKPPDRCFSNTS